MPRGNRIPNRLYCDKEMIMTVRSTAPAAEPGSGAAGTAAGDSRQWLTLADWRT
jgi:hypothetical protein